MDAFARAGKRILNHVDAAVAGGVDSALAVASGIVNSRRRLLFCRRISTRSAAEQRNFARLDAVVAEPETTNLAGIEAGLKHAPASQILQTTGQCLAWASRTGGPGDSGVNSGYRGGGDPGKLLELLYSSGPKVIAAAALP